MVSRKMQAPNENQEKYSMSCQQEALWMKVGAEGLSDAEDDTASQCPPQTPGPTDNSRFECENELHRSDIRIET